MSDFVLHIDTSEAKKAAAAASDIDKLRASLDRTAAAAARVQAVPLSRALTGSVGATSGSSAFLRTLGIQTTAMSRFGKVSIGVGESVKRSLKRSFGESGALLSSWWKRAGQEGGVRQRASSSVMGGLGTLGGKAAGIAGMAGLAVGGAAVAGGGALATSMFMATAQAERLKAALDVVTKGGGDAWFKLSSEYARKFGGDVNVIAENLMQMKASQFSDAMAKDLFLRTQDMKALGASEESLGRMLLAIRQIKAAGRLQGDELNQLGEAGLDASFVYDVLSKKLGKSTQEIIKLKEAGKLTSDIVLPAISEAIGVKTGGKAAGAVGEAAARKTMLGAWGRLTGSFGVAQIEGLGTGALAPVRDGINKLADWINGAGGQRMFAAFGNMMGGLLDKAPAIADWMIEFFDVRLPAIWRKAEAFWLDFQAAFELGGANAAVWDSVVWAFQKLTDNSEGLTGIATVMGTLAGATSMFVGGIAMAIEGVAALVGYIGNMPWWELLTLAIPIVGPLAVLGFELGSALVNGIANGIRSMSSIVSEYFSAMINGAIQSAMNLVAGIPMIGSFVAQGLTKGLTTGTPGVQAAAESMGEGAIVGTKDGAEVRSPSKAADRIGQFVGWGASDGIDKSAAWVAESGRALGDTAIQSLGASAAGSLGGTPALPGGSGGSGVTIQIDMPVNVTGGSTPAATGAAIAQAAHDQLELKLASLFRRMAYSG